MKEMEKKIKNDNTSCTPIMCHIGHNDTLTRCITLLKNTTKSFVLSSLSKCYKHKQRLSEVKHFAQITQLATSGNEAVRSPGRVINKGITRLDRARGGNMRGEMASWLQIPKARKGTPRRKEVFLCVISKLARITDKPETLAKLVCFAFCAEVSWLLLGKLIT